MIARVGSICFFLVSKSEEKVTCLEVEVGIAFPEREMPLREKGKSLKISRQNRKRGKIILEGNGLLIVDAVFMFPYTILFSL